MLNIEIPHKPSLKEYGLTQADVDRLERRQKVIKAIKKIAISLVVASAYGVAVWYIRRQETAPNWAGTLLLAVFYALFAWLIVGFTLTLLFAFFYPLTDSLHPLATRIQKWWSSRHPKQISSKRMMYSELSQALRNYEKKRESLVSQYPDLDKCGFDLKAYSNLVFEQYAPLLYSKIKNIILAKNKRSNVDYWRRMPAERFEEEVAEWFRKKGYNAKVTRFVGDGGIDIILTKGQQTALVQCKHYAEKVGVDPVRALFGVMSSKKIQKGYLACLHGATEGAKGFAKQNGITILTVDDYVKGTYEITLEEIDFEKEHVIGPFKVEKEIYNSLSDAIKQADNVPSAFAFVIELSRLYWDRYYFVLKSETEAELYDGSVKYSRIKAKEARPVSETKEARLENNREVRRESTSHLSMEKPFSIDDIPLTPCRFETVDVTRLLEDAKLNPSVASSWMEFVRNTLSGKPRLYSMLSSGTRVYTKEESSIIVVITVQNFAQKQWLEEKLLVKITSGYQARNKDHDVSICCVITGSTDATVCCTVQKEKNA